MLFKVSDLDQPAVNGDKFESAGIGLNSVSFLDGNKLGTIKTAIGELSNQEAIFFVTDGAWSNVQLLDYLLTKTGPADLFLSTWSISADAIRQLTRWQQEGMIESCFALLDQGIRNRKPEILQQASACFKNLQLVKCHAKVMVISNDQYNITVIGSANFTRNPRKETGMIIQDKRLAEANIKWILEEFADD